MLDDMKSLLQYVSNEYPADKTRPGVTFSFLGAKGYYISILRHPNGPNTKEVIISVKTDTLEELLPALKQAIVERINRNNAGAT